MPFFNPKEIPQTLMLKSVSANRFLASARPIASPTFTVQGILLCAEPTGVALGCHSAVAETDFERQKMTLVAALESLHPSPPRLVKLGLVRCRVEG